MEEFSTPIFEGARFNDHSLPLDIAQDLVAYEKLILDLAKSLYFAENPQRQRLPKGFGKDFHLHIEKIEEGSTKPVLSMMAAGALALSGEQTYLKKAQELVVECFAQATIPDNFPRHALKYFKHIGKSLKADESMGFNYNGTIARLTPTKCRDLQLALDKQYSKDILLTGYVDAPCFEKNNFQLITEEYGQVLCPMDGDLLKDIRNSRLAGFNRNYLTLEALGSFDENDQLKSVSNITTHEVRENAYILDTLESFYELKDGWCGEGSKAFHEEYLQSFISQLVESYPIDLPLPFIAPTAEGDILLEWEEYRDLSADIELETGKAYLHAFNEEGEDIEYEVNFLQDTEKFYKLIEEVIA